MKFTKEQKEVIEEMYNLQLSGSVFGARIKKAFPEVLKPKQKKIVVEIETDNDVKLYGQDFSAIGLERFLIQDRMVKRGGIKVKELPEVFTKKDLREFGDYILSLAEKKIYFNYNLCSYDNVDDWLSERNNNLNKK